EVQERAFRAQLALARRVEKPVLVHCRDAHEDTLAILAEAGVGETGGIMHCFSGDTTIARRCLDLGLLISLAGPVTYPKARALPDVAKAVPADRLVVETDCPYLPPQPYRGERNEPAYLAITAPRVAELRGEPLECLASPVGILLTLLERVAIPPGLRVRLLFTAAEERDCLGAREYVRAVGVSGIVGVLSLELCGIGDNLVVWDATAESPVTRATRGALESAGLKRDE